jgi:hypothetical protein
VLEVFGSESKLGEDFFMRNAFAAGERIMCGFLLVGGTVRDEASLAESAAGR